MLGIQGKFLTAANLLTMSRAILIVPTIYLVVLGEPIHLIFAAVLAIVMIATDILDGYVARKTDTVSEWGRLLDPLMDKFCITLAVLAGVWYKGFPVWMAVIVIGRDILIIVFSLFVRQKIKKTLMSQPLGKAAAFVISVTLIAYLLEADVVKVYLLYLSLILLIVSGIYYAYRALVAVKG